MKVQAVEPQLWNSVPQSGASVGRQGDGAALELRWKPGPSRSGEIVWKFARAAVREL